MVSDIKRRKRGDDSESPGGSTLFSQFVFYLFGSLPGKGMCRTLLLKHGGAVVDGDAAHSAFSRALDGPCPEGSLHGARGCRELVVVHGPDARLRAVQAIKAVLNVPDLLCPRCKTSHLASTVSGTDSVPLLAESITLSRVQTQVKRYSQGPTSCACRAKWDGSQD
jgi:hypothetical protein